MIDINLVNQRKQIIYNPALYLQNQLPELSVKMSPWVFRLSSYRDQCTGNNNKDSCIEGLFWSVYVEVELFHNPAYIKSIVRFTSDWTIDKLPLLNGQAEKFTVNCKYLLFSNEFKHVFHTYPSVYGWCHKGVKRLALIM